MGRLKKHGSKRQTLRTKYKIQAKVKEFNRKQKRLAKKSPHKLHKSRRDPGIPNNWPFKDAALQLIEQQREADKEQKDKLKLERKEKKAAAAAAALAAAEQPAAQPTVSTIQTSAGDALSVRSRQTFKILNTLTDTCHFILFCLDARDPLGSRDIGVEIRAMKRADQAPPVVFVLTHCDLVPSSIVDAWLRYLNVENPAVAFVSDQSLDEPQLRVAANSLRKPCPTILPLLSLLNGYQPEPPINQAIQVAVMGFENTGKSSLINNLLRKHRVGVSTHAGYTKDCQFVTLNERVTLIDTPGIPVTQQRPGPHTILPLDGAPQFVCALAESLDRPMFLRALKCPDFQTTDEFLEILARKYSKLMKGGVPNRITAARNWVRSWNAGSIPYYVHPPANTPETADEVEGLGELFVSANQELVQDRAREEQTDIHSYIALDDSLFGDDDDEEDDDEDMDDEDDESDDGEAPELVPVPVETPVEIEQPEEEVEMEDEEEDEEVEEIKEPTPKKNTVSPRMTRSRGPAPVLKTPPTRRKSVKPQRS